jgi:hypothetical protein
VARSPFRDEEEAALQRVERLEREVAELRAALAAAHRGPGPRMPGRPTVGLVLGVVCAATVTGIVAARLPTSGERTPAAAVTAPSRSDAQWRPLTTSARTLRAAVAVGGTVLLGGEGTLLRFGGAEDDGDDAMPAHWPTIHGLGGQRGRLYAVGEHGSILAEGSGRAWTPESAPPFGELRAVTAAGEDGWAVGVGGTILRRARGKWVAEESGTTRDLYGVTRTTDGVYAVGASGTILFQRPGRATWVEEPSGIAADLLAAFQQDGVVYAVGKGGAIVRRARDGWVREASGTLHDLFAVGGDGQAIFAVGAAGTILRSVGAGVWRSEEAHTTGDLLCVAGAGELVYAAGEGGTLVRRSF